MSDETFTPLKFGDIFMPGGALYAIRPNTAEADIAFAHAEFLKANFIKDGIPLTSVAVAEIEKRAAEKAKEIIGKMKSQGVPESFKKLLEIKKKKDVQRFCRGMTVRQNEFSHFILNANQIGFAHSRQHFQVVPNELRPTKRGRKCFSK
jgi:hypothetical protein